MRDPERSLDEWHGQARWNLEKRIYDRRVDLPGGRASAGGADGDRLRPVARAFSIDQFSQIRGRCAICKFAPT